MPNFTPSAAFITITALSTAASAPRSSPPKFASPGTSSIVNSASPWAKEQTDVEMLARRSFSSGSQFMKEVPSSTRPSREVTPAANRSESARVVFPSPPWPIRAKEMLRRSSLAMVQSSFGGSRLRA